MFKIYFYTLEIALLSTLVAAAVGIPLAYFTARRHFFGRRLILSFSAVSLCVPSLIVTLGYVSFWGMNGTVNRAFGTHFSFLYSTLGIVIAQGFYNVPFIAGIVSEAWERLPREQENAARLLGAGEARILQTVTLRQLAGAIGAACIPVFLFCYFSFMIVLLFSPVGRSTLEVEIYHSIRTTLDVGSGAKLALLETATAFAVVLAYSFVVRRSQTTSSGVNYVPVVRQKLCSDIFNSSAAFCFCKRSGRFAKASERGFVLACCGKFLVVWSCNRNLLYLARFYLFCCS